MSDSRQDNGPMGNLCKDENIQKVIDFGKVSNDMKQYNDFTEIIKKDFGKDITTSQMRNIYGMFLKVKSFQGAVLLRPKLAYLAGKEEKNQDLKMFCDFLDKVLKKVDSKESLKNLKSFLEACVAYHRYSHPES